MPLDPRAQRLLHMLAASRGSGGVQTAEDRRRDLSNLTLMAGGAAPDVAEVEDIRAPTPAGDLALRRYRPAAAGSGAMLFFHGGGWVAGDLDTHDGVCRRLADASGHQVFAVHYRRAPEHPFPAALEDALAAVDWIGAQAQVLGIDPRKLVLAGDSAGGGIAAATCIALRDRGRRDVARLLLICPILDVGKTDGSRAEFAEGFFLSPAAFDRDLADYAPGVDPADPRLSPLRANDLSKLPPTHVHVAEFDPFRDEGRAFAERLRAAGGAADCTEHPGMIHYFYALPGAIPYAETALRVIGGAIGGALG